MKKTSGKNNEISNANDSFGGGAYSRSSAFKWGRILLRVTVRINRMFDWFRTKDHEQSETPSIDLWADFSWTDWEWPL
ncbi:hypothetical protein [Delftia acidovorans]|jgi:hypothetical protein|uniref:hypothetical protein n=1 Tax=Delftia acidovorans TaxID=80866 RepID=UPI002FDE2EBC